MVGYIFCIFMQNVKSWSKFDRLKMQTSIKWPENISFTTGTTRFSNKPGRSWVSYRPFRKRSQFHSDWSQSYVLKNPLWNHGFLGFVSYERGPSDDPSQSAGRRWFLVAESRWSVTIRRSHMVEHSPSMPWIFPLKPPCIFHCYVSSPEVNSFAYESEFHKM